ncbi:MAG: glycosyltransferase family 2 protein [Chloroflexi bacterium]|nr:glycosyltransferase family 2 protein [Chloroflexota bacterium]
MTAELAVIIVSWNTRDLTLQTLRALYEDLEEFGPQAQVWVIDNASADGTPDAVQEAFPQACLVTSQENLGFAGGNNHALRLIGFDDKLGSKTNSTRQLPQAVYLLNSDTITQPGATRALYDALFRLPRAGVVGARLSYGDGSFQHSAFQFPDLGQLLVDLFPVPGRLHESTFNGRYPRAAYSGADPFPVDHTLGATMMLRREVIQETGLFDESYFMYCEEIDWSKRIRQAGWEIYCVPKAHVVHLAGQSTKQVRPQSVVNLWHSRMRFFQAYYPPLKRWTARRLIWLGMRRKIAQTRRAFRAGELPADERDALIDAYRAVRTL